MVPLGLPVHRFTTGHSCHSPTPFVVVVIVIITVVLLVTVVGASAGRRGHSALRAYQRRLLWFPLLSDPRHWQPASTSGAEGEAGTAKVTFEGGGHKSEGSSSQATVKANQRRRRQRMEAKRRQRAISAGLFTGSREGGAHGVAEWVSDFGAIVSVGEWDWMLTHC
mmetsp:Transcript_59513/g.138623  ORF Transcript_59513/g.138623 Transcript_59513/m.138623 type:complete len:166 (-) Transcript_59513:88-585(-)